MKTKNKKLTFRLVTKATGHLNRHAFKSMKALNLFLDDLESRGWNPSGRFFIAVEG